MPRYEVQHRYRSNDFGPWEKGDQITLDDPEEAAYVNRDSPGTLKEIDPEEAAAAKRAKFEADQAALERTKATKTTSAAKSTSTGTRTTGKL